MNQSSAATLFRSALSPQAREAAKQKLALRGLSLSGVVLLLVSLSVFASGSMSMRPHIFGLAVHLYLLPVAVAFPFLVLSRIAVFPPRILAMLTFLTGIYCFSVLSGAGMSLSEIFKMVSAPITIITYALLVRRQGDFVAGTLGLCIAVALLAAKAFASPDHGVSGMVVMEGVANKNSYSMYALPAILLGGYIVLNMKVSMVVKVAIYASSAIALAAIFMTANRSGYLGAVMIAMMLFWDRKGKGLLLVGAVAMVVVYLVLQFGGTDTIEYRLQATVDGNRSDTLRQQLVLVCLEIGLENPLIGVGPQVLPYEIGRHDTAGYDGGASEAHNVYAHIIGGSGLICFAALIGMGWALWSWKLDDREGTLDPKQDPLRKARRLMRSLIVLWAVRGLFTAEILFNPSFNMAIGLMIGYCLLAQKARSAELAEQAKAPPQPGQQRLAVAPAQ